MLLIRHAPTHPGIWPFPASVPVRIDEQKARGPVARPKHGRPGTAQARHGPEDTGPRLGTARVPGRAWAVRQARRVARHGPQLVEGTVEAR